MDPSDFEEFSRSHHIMTTQKGVNLNLASHKEKNFLIEKLDLETKKHCKFNPFAEKKEGSFGSENSLDLDTERNIQSGLKKESIDGRKPNCDPQYDYNPFN